jgi:hypothetical protein
MSADLRKVIPYTAIRGVMLVSVMPGDVLISLRYIRVRTQEIYAGIPVALYGKEGFACILLRSLQFLHPSPLGILKFAVSICPYYAHN